MFECCTYELTATVVICTSDQRQASMNGKGVTSAPPASDVAIGS